MRGISRLNGKYAVTMDLYPPQGKEFTRIQPFFDNLKAGRFTTTKCKSCGTQAFPPRVICPDCISDDLEWIDLPTEATVIESVVEEIGIPIGFETPLVLAMVQLEGAFTFITRVINCKPGTLETGDKLKLAVYDVEPFPADFGRETVEIPRVFFAFEPI
jgi:uncharacterized OB-fold protein